MHRIAFSLSLATIILIFPDQMLGKVSGPRQPVQEEGSTTKTEDSFLTAAAPLFRKYCNSCHNASDEEGGLSLETPAEIAKGGDNGPALLPGDGQSSRMVRMMLGTLEPKMPPDDMESPSKKEIDALIAWIDDGAKVDGSTSLAPQKLVVPSIKTNVSTDPITDLDWSPDGKLIAVARYQAIDVLDGTSRKVLYQLKGHPGKVNSVSFSPDSKFLLAATGVTGLSGIAVEWDLEKREQIRKYKGHSDVIYAAEYSPSASRIATAGYDRKILIWNRDSGKNQPKVERELKGHNGAVYDLDFDPSGKVLASASADQTVKLWNADNGTRLDTLGQPLKEQFVARIHPGGQFVFGTGRDNRIRSWQLISREKPAINPLLISRFAHEASIVALAFSKDGSFMVSSAEDRTIKVWTGTGIELITSLPQQRDVAFALDLSPDSELAVGRMDGSLEFYSLKGLVDRSQVSATRISASPVIQPNSSLAQPAKPITELEPNSEPMSPQKIEVPAVVEGKLQQEDNSESLSSGDVDLYRFSAKKGETWVIETNAARSKSKADTKVAVLDLKGQPILRAKLQAVRDSYFTFRGKDANTSDDFRVHNWEEMELNELLYCNGELVRLYLYPRGPDSGFKVYPGFGNRHNFLDTTATAHALQEPCYIVKAFAPDADITPNGLPVFDLFYENDDDAKRKMGSDSKLFFTAPEDGDYLIKVTDSRGFDGPKFSYRLTVRSPKPDFSVGFGGKKMTLKRGSGREFSLTANRVDHFKGAIDVLFENIPAGIHAPKKITIEENHFKAFGTFHVSQDAAQPTAEQIANIKLTAVATVDGKKVSKDLGKIEELKLQDSPKIQTRILASATGLDPEKQAAMFDQIPSEPIVLTVRPGTTLRAFVAVKRNQHGGDVDFGNADSGRNLPHGVFVDNIGLNGLRIIKGQGDVREVFITAAKWVPEQERLFHLRANNVEGETTFPVLLKVAR